MILPPPLTSISEGVYQTWNVVFSLFLGALMASAPTLNFFIFGICKILFLLSLNMPLLLLGGGFVVIWLWFFWGVGGSLFFHPVLLCILAVFCVSAHSATLSRMY